MHTRRNWSERQIITGYARETQLRPRQTDLRYGYTGDVKTEYLDWDNVQPFYKSHLDAVNWAGTALGWRSLSASEMKYYASGMEVWRQSERVIQAGIKQKISEIAARDKLREQVHEAQLERDAATTPEAKDAARAKISAAEAVVKAYEDSHFKEDFGTAGRFVAFNGLAQYYSSAPVKHVPIPAPLTKMPETP